jgi:hypothetical protein
VNNEPHNLLPTWAPRVTQQEIRRLYETDAQGIYDQELIDEVGYGLLARCQSFMDAVDAVRGQARCPRCSSVVMHTGDKEEILRCECGWELAWGDYFRTIQHKQLSGAEPVLDQFRAFVHGFPLARTPQAKMILIDRLIHGFHWYYMTNTPTRPVAINLIEGRLSEVVAFLDNLSRGDKSTAGVAENYAQWDEGIEANSDWYASRRARHVEPEGSGDTL